MKCEVCQELLEEYLDGELPAADHAQVESHLITCAECSASFATLTAEQELFARYDREIEVPPFLWTRVAAHTVAAKVPRNGWQALLGSFSKSFAGAIAILLLAAAIGLVYWSRHRTDQTQAQNQKQANNRTERGSAGS